MSNTDCGKVLGQLEAPNEDSIAVSNQPEISHEDSPSEAQRTEDASVQLEDREVGEPEPDAQQISNSEGDTLVGGVRQDEGSISPPRETLDVVLNPNELTTIKPKFVAVVNQQDNLNKSSEGESNLNESPSVVVVCILPKKKKKKKRVVAPDYPKLLAAEPNLKQDASNAQKTSNVKFLVSVIESYQQETANVSQHELRSKSKRRELNSRTDVQLQQTTVDPGMTRSPTVVHPPQASGAVLDHQDAPITLSVSDPNHLDSYENGENQNEKADEEVATNPQETTGEGAGISRLEAVQSQQTSVTTANQQVATKVTATQNQNADECTSVLSGPEADDNLRIFVTLLMGLLSTKCKSWQKLSLEQWVEHNNKLVCLILSRVTLCEGFTPDLKDAKGMCRAALRDLERYFCGRHILESVITMQDPTMDEAIVRIVCYHIRQHSEKLYRRATTRGFWRKELLRIFQSLFSFIRH